MNFAFRLPLAALLLTFCLPMFSLSAKAQNAARLPDLIVTDVLVSPAHPFAGDTVRFRVVIKNQGTAPTPEGVVIGGIFKLNGSTIAYTDQYKNALAPGESATLTANGGGGNGAGVWIAKAGSYTLGFQVDDVNRITESDKKNNELILPQPLKIVAFDGPDIVTRRLVWKRSKTAGKITLQAEITNIGNRPTAADVPIETRFLIDGAAVGAGKTAARSLPPGQSVIVAFGPVALPAGRHTIEALADPKGKIKERRTDNNRLLREAWVDQPMQYRAKPADDFADSVGVCIHLGYYDTAYGHYDTIKARLIESGVRYVREGVNLAGSDVIHKLNDLAASGIRSNLVLDPRQVSPEQAVLLVKALKNSVVSVEGPNEPNLFYSDWFPDSIRDYQKKLYAALKADPETAALPVLSPALAFPVEIAGRLGAVACDFGAMHPYPGGQLPDAGLDAVFAATQTVAPNKPVMITETGYNTAIHVTSGQPAVSETAEAKYIPRLLLEAFNRGAKRSFLYEFSDEHPEPAMREAEQHFGLIRADGTPKPAFAAVANIIRLLQDRGAAFRSGLLRCRISGDVTGLRYTLLQKSDGRFYLILWTNGRSYDQDAQADAAIPTQAITVRFERPFSRATLHRPAQSGKSIRFFGAANSLTLDVPDEPLIIELSIP